MGKRTSALGTSAEGLSPAGGKRGRMGGRPRLSPVWAGAWGVRGQPVAVCLRPQPPRLPSLHAPRLFARSSANRRTCTGW